jgi:hypothetical protein
MRSTFSVIFYLKKEKLKKDGTNPIMGRITVDGTMAQFSCKQSCDPAIWEAKGGHAKGKTIAARDINRELRQNKGLHSEALSGDYDSGRLCDSRESQELVSWPGISQADSDVNL